jgi:Circadian oscillating protein COP23
MKIYLISTQAIASTIAIVLSTIPWTLQAANSSIKLTESFSCRQSQGVYTTLVRMPSGKLYPMIRWVPNLFANYFPQERCMEVTKRFQRLADNSLLQLVSTGVINRSPVLCGVQKVGQPCTNQNLLVTLPFGIDRHQAAKKLFDIRARTKGKILELSGSNKLVVQQAGETYINIEQLKQALAEQLPGVEPND